MRLLSGVHRPALRATFPIIIITVIVYMVGEAAVMGTLHAFDLHGRLRIVLDPILLALLCCPAMFLLVLRPLARDLQKPGESELEQQNSREFLQAVIDAIPSGTLVLGRDYRILLAIRAGDSYVLDPNVPIVAMTANAMTGDREACLAAGMDDYLAKPVTPQALADIVARSLSPSGAEASAHDAETTETPTMILDMEALISRVEGDEALAGEVIEQFAQTLSQALDDIRAVTDSGDLGAVQEHAHGLKGAAATLGAERLAGLARRIEDAAGRHDADALATLVARLDDECENFRDELAAVMCPS